MHADEHAIAFLDIGPWKRGHTLVIPRRHVDDVLAADEALTEIAPAIGATARLLTDRLGADGLNMLSSAGPVAGQGGVPPARPIAPRYAGDPGLRRLFDRDPLDRPRRGVRRHHRPLIPPLDAVRTRPPTQQGPR